MPSKGTSAVVVRRAAAEDAATCGQICYDAFTAISTAHGFPPDFPNPEVAAGLFSSMFSNPNFYCVVAEMDGRIVGSNCLDERAIIRGVGPVTIHPGVQNVGVGRLLMQVVMDRARDRGAPGVAVGSSGFSQSLFFPLYLSWLRRPRAALLPAGTDSRTQRSRMPSAARYTSRRGCLQLALSPRSWLRPCRRAGTGHLAWHRPRGRTRRPCHRIHDPPRFLWPLHVGDESGHASTTCFGRVLCRPWNPCPLSQQRLAAVVPAEWSPRCSTPDSDERWAV